MKMTDLSVCYPVVQNSKINILPRVGALEVRKGVCLDRNGIIHLLKYINLNAT